MYWNDAWFFFATKMLLRSRENEIEMVCSIWFVTCRLHDPCFLQQTVESIADAVSLPLTWTRTASSPRASRARYVVVSAKKSAVVNFCWDKASWIGTVFARRSRFQFELDLSGNTYDDLRHRECALELSSVKPLRHGTHIIHNKLLSWNSIFKCPCLHDVKYVEDIATPYRIAVPTCWYFVMNMQFASIGPGYSQKFIIYLGLFRTKCVTLVGTNGWQWLVGEHGVLYIGAWSHLILQCPSETKITW